MQTAKFPNQISSRYSIVQIKLTFTMIIFINSFFFFFLFFNQCDLYLLHYYSRTNCFSLPQACLPVKTSNVTYVYNCLNVLRSSCISVRLLMVEIGNDCVLIYLHYPHLKLSYLLLNLFAHF